MGITPVIPHFRGQLREDKPVRSAVAERRHHRIKPLDASLGIDVGALFFHARAPRQYHIGKLRRAAEKEILHHQEIELRKALMHIGCVRVRKGGLLTDNIHRAKLIAGRQLDHHKIVLTHVE